MSIPEAQSLKRSPEKPRMICSATFSTDPRSGLTVLLLLKACSERLRSEQRVIVVSGGIAYTKASVGALEDVMYLVDFGEVRDVEDRAK